MILGQVVGTVVATRKSETLVGQKLLVLKPLYTPAKEEVFVAVDTVGAGVGETVLVALGSGARLALHKEQAPIDAAIVGIVDTVKISGSE
ncbi:EutN/CcmL family microcompartment protein [Paradesulfitobacterium ferrireducens]|uniref:EutN/CcmL family microcompartment protein n=1 Tax=Paradesulfitobacterium ferrireducens TaxID=2816476 RepID=UPI001A8CB738|nr:EutN/CcmL family microcompartment protein [Paradesulfitobacterium ferrireducens]